MSHVKLYAISLAAAAGLLGAIAHADEPNTQIDKERSTVVYKGIDTQGRLVCLTVPNVGVQFFERAPAAPKRFPEPHWTSRIGTGEAAAYER
jgi:hypothetical protein